MTPLLRETYQKAGMHARICRYMKCSKARVRALKYTASAQEMYARPGPMSRVSPQQCSPSCTRMLSPDILISGLATSTALFRYGAHCMFPPHLAYVIIPTIRSLFPHPPPAGPVLLGAGHCQHLPASDSRLYGASRLSAVYGEAAGLGARIPVVQAPGHPARRGRGHPHDCRPQFKLGR